MFSSQKIKSPAKGLRQYLSQTGGNISVIFSIALVTVAIVVGAAVDVTRLVSTDQKLQDALDAATLYAATLPAANDMNADARLFLTSKTDALALQGLSIDFSRSGDSVIGTATGDLNLVFGGVLGREVSGVAAKTVVNMPSSGACIVALSQTKSPGLLMNNGADITAPNCEVHTHSTGNPAATINGATTLNAKRTCIAGRTILNYSSDARNIETGCQPAGDPYAGAIPVPNSSGCDYNARVYVDPYVTLNPGVYCDSHNFQLPGMEVTLNPGLYVVKGGGWRFNYGTVKGDGVTLYFIGNSEVHFNSQTKSNLSAPTSGPYANVLIAEDGTGTGVQYKIDDNRGFDFVGIIHLPTRELVMNGGSTVHSRSMSIVADTIIINGAKLAIEPFSGGNDGDPYISQ